VSRRISWFYSRERLREALARWHDVDILGEDGLLVDNALMDLLADPLTWGKEDGESGVWTGWAGDDILIVYVPDRDTGQVAVVDINYAGY